MQAGHRCLVPVTSFSEYDHRTKPPTCTWFAQDETRPLMFFAGIWRPWTGTRGTKAEMAIGNHLVFSFLTTTPNPVVGAVHPKAMPVLLLTEADREAWLTDPLEDALALQCPAPEQSIRIVATGQKQDAP
jgi:putative SOS response-associated peptidase YedK